MRDTGIDKRNVHEVVLKHIDAHSEGAGILQEFFSEKEPFSPFTQTMLRHLASDVRCYRRSGSRTRWHGDHGDTSLRQVGRLYGSSVLREAALGDRSGNLRLSTLDDQPDLSDLAGNVRKLLEPKLAKAPNIQKELLEGAVHSAVSEALEKTVASMGPHHFG